jgi:hypothetical protein
LEALLCLGSRELLLVAADFAAVKRDCPRAEGALGRSPREFTIPVRGNRGRTVFSEPGLLHTGYLLNRVIASTPGCQVLRLGEGAVLEAAETVDASDNLALRFGRASGGLEAALADLPPRVQGIEVIKIESQEVMATIPQTASQKRQLMEGTTKFAIHALARTWVG